MEQRLGDLEAQMERLTLALVRWRETEEHRPALEHRLEQLTEQCAALLKQWTATSERHAQAVGELETQLTGWHDIEARLQRETFSRFQGLERTIEREWASLRHLHEEPVRELREQAETLTEISVTAAGSAQKGIERAEARLAALEHDLHRRMDDLARDIHSVLAELRQHGATGLRAPASSWSLDEVTRLHHELREADPAAGKQPTSVDRPEQNSSTLARRGLPPVLDARAEIPHPEAAESHQSPSPRPVVEDRTDVQRESTLDPSPSSRANWKWYAALTALVAVAVATAAFAWSFYGKANDAAQRASEAQERAERVATAADARIEAARRDAAAQIVQAREAASKAQVTTDVLAASDLVRFNLLGADPAARMSAQLLWSRSRGMVFTASRIPQPRAGTIYQIWLLTAGAPVSAGTFTPDASGRVSVATDSPPPVPRPITGVRVTAEPVPASEAPSGETILGRIS
jgi:hypothetical protein